jgi:hypothetical protein
MRKLVARKEANVSHCWISALLIIRTDTATWEVQSKDGKRNS